MGEWRCANGDGPLDQVRVTFEVDHKIEKVYEFLTSWVNGNKGPNIIEHTHLGDNPDGTIDLYLAVRMP